MTSRCNRAPVFSLSPSRGLVGMAFLVSCSCTSCVASWLRQHGQTSLAFVLVRSEIQASATRAGVGPQVEYAMQKFQDNKHIQEQGNHLLKKLSLHGAAHAVQAAARLMHHNVKT